MEFPSLLVFGFALTESVGAFPYRDVTMSTRACERSTRRKAREHFSICSTFPRVYRQNRPTTNHEADGSRPQNNSCNSERQDSQDFHPGEGSDGATRSIGVNHAITRPLFVEQKRSSVPRFLRQIVCFTVASFNFFRRGFGGGRERCSF
jgi:hypothetical protein